MFLLKEGIYPALVVPFDCQENLNETAVGDMVESLLKQGVSGFYVGGSTGEYLLMTPEERMRMLECVCESACGRCHIIAHIGQQRPRDSIRLAKHAAGMGVQAVSSLPPLYYKYTQQEIAAFYLEIANAAGVPLIIYNAPALSGFSFTPDNIAPLFASDRIAGIKYTSYDLFGMERIMSRYPSKLMINGHDELFLSTLILGVRHAIGSTFNFMPQEFLALRHAFDRHDQRGAQRKQAKINQIIEGLLQIGVFRGVKGMLNLLGMNAGSCRAPFAPLSKEENEQLEKLAQLLENEC